MAFDDDSWTTKVTGMVYGDIIHPFHSPVRKTSLSSILRHGSHDTYSTHLPCPRPSLEVLTLLLCIMVWSVVWEWWDVSTGGQYALSWIVIVLAVILYKGLGKLDSSIVRRAIETSLPQGAIGERRQLDACSLQACGSVKEVGHLCG